MERTPTGRCPVCGFSEERAEAGADFACGVKPHKAKCGMPFIASDSRQFPLPPNKRALAFAKGSLILQVSWSC